MGYCMSMVEATAFIADENIPGAVAALKLLDKTGNKSGGGYYGEDQPQRHWFAWVAENWVDTDDIEELFEAWRYELERNDRGGYSVVCFNGEKFGDDDQFWNALSPYMQGYVQMLGEEGEQWRWVLGGERVANQEGTVKFG